GVADCHYGTQDDSTSGVERCTADSDRMAHGSEPPLCQSRPNAPHKMRHYSITWSAAACRVNGIARPSALAVLRLITSSKRVGCSTGRSPGLAPFRILSR